MSQEKKNKKIKVAILILWILLVAGILAGIGLGISKNKGKDTTNVKKDDGVYTVNILKTAHGSVTANKTEAKEGEEIVLTVTPDENYELKSLVANKKKSETTFKMPAEDVDVFVRFALKEGIFVGGEFFGKSGDFYSSDMIDFSTDRGEEPYLVMDAGKATPLYAYINDLSEKQFFFETEVKVTGINDGEKYPKFGVMTNDETEMVKFYLDMNPSKKVSGIGTVHQATGKDDDWENQDYFPLDKEFKISKKTVKLGFLRNGKTYYFYVDDKLVSTGTDLKNQPGAAGVFTFGTSLELSDYKMVKSGTDYNKLLSKAKSDAKKFNAFKLTTNYFKETKDGVYTLKTNSADEGKVDDVKYEGKVLKTAYYSIKGKITLKNSKDWSQARILVSSDPKNEYVFALEQTAKNKYQIFTMSKKNENVWSNWTSIVDAEVNGNRKSLDFEVIADGKNIYFLIDDMIVYTSKRVSMKESTVKFAGYKNCTTVVESLDGQVFANSADVQKYIATKDADSFWVYGLTTNYFKETKDGVYTLTTKSKDESKVDDVIYGGNKFTESCYSVKGKLSLTKAEDWSQARILISADPENEYVIALEQTSENMYQIFSMSKADEQSWNKWELIAHAEAKSSKNSIDFEVVVDGSKIYFLVDDEICYTSDRVSMKESTVKFASYNKATTTVENISGQTFANSKAVQKYLETKDTKAYESPFQDRIDARYQEYFVDNDCAGKGGTLLLGHSHMDPYFWNEWEPQTGLTNYVNGYNVGIGGTTTMDWLYAYDKLVKPFNADRFVISLGENDITGWGAEGAEVVERLSELFEKIHTDHPDAEIYYIYSLPAETKYVDGKWLNAEYEALVKGEKELCDSLGYVQGISMFELLVDSNDNVKTELYRPNKDIHLNADGYKVWSDHLYNLLFKGENFGVTKDGDTYYKTTNGIELSADKGNDATVDIFGGAPRYAYLNNTFTDKAYFEAEFNVSEVLNNDSYPKFGIIFNGKTESIKFFVDMNANMEATAVGVVHQPTDGDDDWANVSTANVSGMKFTGNNKVKLGVVRDSKAYYFYVNDKLVLAEEKAFTTEKTAVGIFSFNAVLNASNYKVYVGNDADSYIEQAKKDVKLTLSTYHFKENATGEYTLTTTNTDESLVDNVERGGKTMKAAYYSVKGSISLTNASDWGQARILISADPQNEYVIALEQTGANKYQIFTMSKAGEEGWNEWKLITHADVNGNRNSLDFEVIAIKDKMYFLVDDKICYTGDGVSMTESTVKFAGYNKATTKVKGLDGQIFETKADAEAYVKTKSVSVGENFGMTIGDGGFYQTSDQINLDKDKGNNPSIYMYGGSPRYAYLNDTFTNKFYFEAELNVSEVLNNDNYPKFGLMFNGKTEMVKYFVDMSKEMTAANVGVVHQKTGQGDDWLGSISKAVSGMKFTGEDTVKLAVARDGRDYYFYVNDELVISRKNTLYNEKGAIGIFSFNSVVTVSNYKIYKDAAADSYIVAAKAKAGANFFGAASSFTTTSDVDLSKDPGALTGTTTVKTGGSKFLYARDFYQENYYFETKVHVNAVYNNDAWPKFGILVQDGAVQELFFVDMSPSKTSSTVGVVHDYNWGGSVSASVSGMKFSGDGEYVTLGLLKQGGKFTFYVNGNQALTYNSSFTGKTTVGVFGFNTGMTIKDYYVEKK